MHTTELVIFDLDNTLTESRQSLEPETALLLRELLQEKKVAVISGAAFWQFEKQLLSALNATERELSSLYILTTSGAELWIYKNGCWKREYLEKFKKSDKKKVLEAFGSVLNLTQKQLEPLIDDRDSGMTYSALGKDATPDVKNPWDPDQKKRKALVTKIAPLVPHLELRIGGTTSIDIMNKGIDKAFGVNKILDFTHTKKEDAIFVGDALFPDGNDEPVKKTGVETISTTGPHNTREIIEGILNGGETIDAVVISFSKNPIAFFCAEYGLDDNSLRFAGGLGVLAADYLYEARDMNVPAVCVGLWYKGQNTKKYPLVLRDGRPFVIHIPFEKNTIEARVRARKFGSVWLLLLETDDDALSAPYSLDEYTWVKQDLILGMGGAKALATLSLEPCVYHLNEGHACFAAFELLAQKASKRTDKNIEKACDEVRKKIVATKHTILKAGVKIYQIDFMRYFGPYCDDLGVSAQHIFDLGIDAETRAFSGTHFVLALSSKKSAVSVLHAQFERQMHPKSDLIAITNGVYRDRWLSPRWLSAKTADEKHAVKSLLRKELVKYTNTTTGSQLDPNKCTVVWARRFAAYKRPEALITDLERLKKIASGEQGIQFIISGKVYLDEPTSTATLNKILELAKRSEWKDKIAYLPDYSIAVAHRLVEGADVWLNTPRRGKEACGTSGMKASLNGALQMTVSDGWVGEVDWKGVGWVLPEDDTVRAMYDFLEYEVAPLFYTERNEWILRMEKTRNIVEANYTTTRMMHDYKRKLYNTGGFLGL